MYLLESLAEGRYVQPCFLVDVHAPSVQGLYYGLGLREKKVVATSSTFSDSNVLNTMKGSGLNITANTLYCVVYLDSLNHLLHLSYACAIFCICASLFPQLTVTPLLLSASFFVLVISRYLDRQLRSFVHLIKSVLTQHHLMVIKNTSILLQRYTV